MSFKAETTKRKSLTPVKILALPEGVRYDYSRMPLKKAKLSGKSKGKSAASLLSDVLPQSDSQWMLGFESPSGNEGQHSVLDDIDENVVRVI